MSLQTVLLDIASRGITVLVHCCADAPPDERWRFTASRGPYAAPVDQRAAGLGACVECGIRTLETAVPELELLRGEFAVQTPGDMDVEPLMLELAENGAGSLAKCDAERLAERGRPWTFAVVGKAADTWARRDHNSLEESVRSVLRSLKKRGAEWHWVDGHRPG